MRFWPRCSCKVATTLLKSGVERMSLSFEFWHKRKSFFGAEHQLGVGEDVSFGASQASEAIVSEPDDVDFRFSVQQEDSANGPRGLSGSWYTSGSKVRLRNVGQDCILSVSCSCRTGLHPVSGSRRQVTNLSYDSTSRNQT